MSQWALYRKLKNENTRRGEDRDHNMSPLGSSIGGLCQLAPSQDLSTIEDAYLGGYDSAQKCKNTPSKELEAVGRTNSPGKRRIAVGTDPI